MDSALITTLMATVESLLKVCGAVLVIWGSIQSGDLVWFYEMGLNSGGSNGYVDYEKASRALSSACGDKLECTMLVILMIYYGYSSVFSDEKIDVFAPTLCCGKTGMQHVKFTIASLIWIS